MDRGRVGHGRERVAERLLVRIWLSRRDVADRDLEVQDVADVRGADRVAQNGGLSRRELDLGQVGPRRQCLGRDDRAEYSVAARRVGDAGPVHRLRREGHPGVRGRGLDGLVAALPGLERHDPGPVGIRHAGAAPLGADLELVPVVRDRGLGARHGLGIDVAAHAKGRGRVGDHGRVRERVSRDGRAFVDCQRHADAGVDGELHRVDELVQVNTGVAIGGHRVRDEGEQDGQRRDDCGGLEPTPLHAPFLNTRETNPGAVRQSRPIRAGC